MYPKPNLEAMLTISRTLTAQQGRQAHLAAILHASRQNVRRWFVLQSVNPPPAAVVKALEALPQIIQKNPAIDER